MAYPAWAFIEEEAYKRSEADARLEARIKALEKLLAKLIEDAALSPKPTSAAS
jgi:hypothetical protein